jgi:hypothetical protein
MPTKKKTKAARVRIDRKLPRKLQLRHATLVVRLERALAGHGKPKGVQPGTMERSNNPLVDAFLQGFYCGQTGELLEQTTQYLHDNWNDLPEETRNALEKQTLEVLNNYANNC